MTRKKPKRKCDWCGNHKTTIHSVKGHEVWHTNPLKKKSFLCHSCKMSYNYQLNREKYLEISKKDYEKNRVEKIAYQKRYEKKNHTKISKRRQEYSHIKREENKEELYKLFSKGAPKCTCCGVTGTDFLTVDHIIPKKQMAKNKKLRKLNFKEKMKGDNIVSWLLKHIDKKYVRKYFQILCWNCNRGKFVEGICPHKIKDYWQTVLLRL